MNQHKEDGGTDAGGQWQSNGRTHEEEGENSTMKRLTLVLAVIVVTLVVGLAARPVLAASIPEVEAIVTLKDFPFEFFTDPAIPECDGTDPERPCARVDNPIGVAVDSKGNIKVGILGLSPFGPNGLPIAAPNKRESTPILTVTPEGRVSDFASFPLATDLTACEDARPGRDWVVEGVLLQEPSPFVTGFAYHRNGDLYVGVNNCIPGQHGIWRVKKDGSAELFAQVPLSQLPVGLAFSKNDDFPLLVTDLHDFTHTRDANLALRPEVPNCRVVPCTLKIWRIDSDGTVTDWKVSELFYGNVNSPLLHPHGVNGIAVDKAGKNVYVLVTDHARVIRIPINEDGTAGDLEVIFESPTELPPDQGGNPLNQGQPRYWGMYGMTLGPDGNLYIVSVRTDELVALPSGLAACPGSPPPPGCNGNSIQVLYQGHPLEGPAMLTFGQSGHDRKDDKAGKSLPPLYITNGSGRRTFFVNGARFYGEGDLLTGIEVLISFGAISPEEAINLQPHSSLVRVLLSTETTGGGDE
jgi:hypothetical protein